MKRTVKTSLFTIALVALAGITSSYINYNQMGKTSLTKQLKAEGERGKVKTIFPPGNNGTRPGVVMIEGIDGNRYVAQTPGDNNGAKLFVGQDVVFTTSDQDHMESKVKEGKKGLNAVNVKVI